MSSPSYKPVDAATLHEMEKLYTRLYYIKETMEVIYMGLVQAMKAPIHGNTMGGRDRRMAESHTADHDGMPGELEMEAKLWKHRIDELLTELRRMSHVLMQYEERRSRELRREREFPRHPQQQAQGRRDEVRRPWTFWDGVKMILSSGSVQDRV